MMQFMLDGIKYESNKKETYFYKSTGKCDKKGNPIMMRISKKIWDEAYSEWAKILGNNLDAKVKEKKTLTPKQKRFVELLPTDGQFENLDSQIYTDVYCDTISAEFNPMSAGAIVTTLKEKGIIDVGVNKVDGRKCKFFSFTDEGKKIVKDILDK